MARDGYLIGESALNRLRAVVQRVEGTPNGSQITRIATAHDEGPPYYCPHTFRIGTFTGSWPVGEQKEVSLASEGDRTVVATNLFFPIAIDQGTASAVDCAIARDGTAWFLIDVPFETATAVFVTGVSATTSVASFFSTAVATIVSEVATSSVACVSDVSASLNTNNCTIVVSKVTQNVSVVTSITKNTVVIATPTTSLSTSVPISVGGTYVATYLRIRS